MWVGSRLRGTRNHAKLLHHTQGIHENAGRLDLPPLKPINDHAPDPDHTVGRGNPEELVLMRAGPEKAGEDSGVSWQGPGWLLGRPSGERLCVLCDAGASDEAFVPGIEGQAQATVNQEFFEDLV